MVGMSQWIGSLKSRMSRWRWFVVLLLGRFCLVLDSVTFQAYLYALGHVKHARAIGFFQRD